MNRKKVVIAGSGYVGATAAYTLVMNNTANEVVLIDVNRNKAEGDALDIRHGMSFLPPVKIRAGCYEDCAGAAMVILTAGAAQKPGESRMSLLERNKAIFDGILQEMLPHLDDKALLLTVTNPVDVLTGYVLEKSGLPQNRAFGSGTVLDTSRLKGAIAAHMEIDPRNVHTFVIGEHGDSEVAAFSATTISGMRLDQYCVLCNNRDCCDPQKTMAALHEEVRGAAYCIIEKKGATCYAVALAINRIAEAVLNDQKAILTVSGYTDGPYGINGVCLSLPRVVGAGGIERLLEVAYNGDETEKLRHSAKMIANYTRPNTYALSRIPAIEPSTR